MKACEIKLTAKKVGIDIARFAGWTLAFIIAVVIVAWVAKTFLINAVLMVMLGGLILGLGALVALHIRDRYHESVIECDRMRAAMKRARDYE